MATDSSPDNWRVCVVVCPVCDEPVIADLALSSSDTRAPALIRHHVQRQTQFIRGRGRWVDEQVVHCSGSKTLVDATDPVNVRRSDPRAESDLRVELHQGRDATVHERGED